MSNTPSVVSTEGITPATLKKVWICEYVDCQAIYEEYVNGCPRCHTGETGGGSMVVPAMVVHCASLGEKVIQFEKLQDAVKELRRYAECEEAYRRYLAASCGDKEYWNLQQVLSRHKVHLLSDAVSMVDVLQSLRSTALELSK